MTSRDVTSGVPQGSVLGPILFLVYVNNIMAGTVCSWKAFADDFKLCTYLSRTNFDDHQSALQSDLNKIYSRATSWNLKLNPGKCVVVRFGERSAIPAATYAINGEVMNVVGAYRDLGVIVDSKLRFHEHVRVMVGKCGGLMSELLRSTVCRGKEFMVALFISHIRPIIDYCSCVWNVGYVGDVRLVESLQRRWTREVLGFERVQYCDRLKSLGLFSVFGRLLRMDLIKIWKGFHPEVDVGISGLFDMAQYSGTRGHLFKLSVPRCHSEVLRRSFGVRRVKIWNDLPAHVVETSCLTTFKRFLDMELGSKLYATV